MDQKLVFLVLVLMAIGSTKAEAICVDPLSLDSPQFYSSLNEDLFLRYESEIQQIKAKLSNDPKNRDNSLALEVSKLNEQDLLRFVERSSQLGSHCRSRIQELTPSFGSNELASQILKRVRENPPKLDSEFSGKRSIWNEIGFCFGRAAMTHFELMQKGVDAKRIAKIFAIGDLYVDRNIWDYHVTTIYQDEFGIWWTLDNLFESSLPLRIWMQEVANWAADRKKPKIRFYFTDPFKFQPHIGRYTKENFSNKLYGNYFGNLLNFYQMPNNCITQYFQMTCGR